MAGKIKLLATDLDGTVLGDELSEANFKLWALGTVLPISPWMRSTSIKLVFIGMGRLKNWNRLKWKL